MSFAKRFNKILYRRYVLFKIYFLRIISAGENSATAKGTRRLIAAIVSLCVTVLRLFSRVLVMGLMAIASVISAFRSKKIRDSRLSLRQRTENFFDSIGKNIKYSKRPRLVPVSLLCACVIGIFSLSYFGVGVEVFVDGKSYGFVNSRQEVLSIVHEVEEETARYLGRPYNMQADLSYSLAYVQRDRMVNPKDFKELLFSNVNEVSMKYVLLLDGKIIGANSSKTSLELLKQKLLYEKAPQADGANTSFVQNITIEERQIANSYIKTIDEIEQELMANTREVKMHDVQKGDTLNKIAQQYGISAQALKSLNPDVAESGIKLGGQIRVAAAVPVLSVKTTKTVTYDETIAYDVDVQYSDSLYKNQTKVTQDGQTGLNRIVAEVVYIDGKEAERVELSRTVVKEPVLEVKVMGTKALPTTAATGSFRWPLYGTITSRYGYRWGSEFHTGLDIARASGSQIVAADGGTVTLAGYNGNYGYCVIIDHGNGYTTLYGHCSKLLVKKGQKVAKGEKIALVGSTGRSTGPHLHFEVRKRGNLVNPAGYLK